MAWAVSYRTSKAKVCLWVSSICWRSISPSVTSIQAVLVVKNPPAHAGDVRDTGSIPWAGRSPGEGNGSHFSILAGRII